MIYAGIIEARDLTKSLQKEESWSIPDALNVFVTSLLQPTGAVDNLLPSQDNLRTYATAFLLCPTLSTYRGKVVGKLIVSFLVMVGHYTTLSFSGGIMQACCCSVATD
jgi:hypothetical protein